MFDTKYLQNVSGRFFVVVLFLATVEKSVRAYRIKRVKYSEGWRARLHHSMARRGREFSEITSSVLTNAPGNVALMLFVFFVLFSLGTLSSNRTDLHTLGFFQSVSYSCQAGCRWSNARRTNCY